MMSREIITGIYKITNLVNGKMYIGQSIDIYKRWKEHNNIAFRTTSKSYNYPLYKAIRKYGIDNFKFEIIEECSIEKLNDKEIYYINKYNTCIFNKNSFGYNMTLGGEGHRGYKHSEESKRKIGEASKGNQYAKGVNIGNQYAKGNKLSEETKKQMGISRKKNVNNGCKYIQCLETGEIQRVNEWKIAGYHNVWRAVKEGKTCCGYHFVYVEIA